MSFDALGLPATILRVLEEEAYLEPTPIQAGSIPALLAGRDLLGSAQTGTGKTAAFSLPLIVRLSQRGLQAGSDSSASDSRPAALRTRQGIGRNGRRGGQARTEPFRAVPDRPVRGLILAPTRELAIQIQDSLRIYGRDSSLRQTVIVGGVSQFHQERALRQGADIVVATPGRLVDLMGQGVIDLSKVEIFVLDEADRMFDLGFLPDMKRITAALPRERQNVMFSATMPAPLEELANGVLRDPVRVSIEPVEETTNLIDQTLCYVPQSDKTRLLIKLLARDAGSRSIVFARTKHGADRIAEQLERAGIKAEALHGNKSQNARQRILASFKSSRPPVLVATDLAARGIDVDGVSHVFNFDLPNEPETYVHRIGRTGRAGATGRAIAFCAPAEMKHLVAIEKLMEEAIPVDAEHSMQRPAMAAPEKREKRRGYGNGYSGSRGGYIRGGRSGGNRNSRGGGSRPPRARAGS
ncbi:MAG: DEAD/DEAH box helicase [Aureliella sp.]